MQNNSREEIVQRIAAIQKGRAAIAVDSSNKSAEIYKDVLPDAITCFKDELEAISGQCIVCDNELDLYSKLKEFVQQRQFRYVYCRDNVIASRLEANQIPNSALEADFLEMEAGITTCEFLVARTGSVLISSASASGRQMNIFPPIHIVLANTSQLVSYLTEALDALQQKYKTSLPSIISTITGPSRTADIEKTLVLGAHGPKEFIVFLYKV